MRVPGSAALLALAALAPLMAAAPAAAGSPDRPSVYEQMRQHRQQMQQLEVRVSFLDAQMKCLMAEIERAEAQTRAPDPDACAPDRVIGAMGATFVPGSE